MKRMTRTIAIGIVSYLADVGIYVSGGMVISYFLTGDKVLLGPMAGVYFVSLAVRLVIKHTERKHPNASKVGS